MKYKSKIIVDKKKLGSTSYWYPKDTVLLPCFAQSDSSSRSSKYNTPSPTVDKNDRNGQYRDFNDCKFENGPEHLDQMHRNIQIKHKLSSHTNPYANRAQLPFSNYTSVERNRKSHQGAKTKTIPGGDLLTPKILTEYLKKIHKLFIVQSNMPTFLFIKFVVK